MSEHTCPEGHSWWGNVVGECAGCHRLFISQEAHDEHLVEHSEVAWFDEPGLKAGFYPTREWLDHLDPAKVVWGNRSKKHGQPKFELVPNADEHGNGAWGLAGEEVRTGNPGGVRSLEHLKKMREARQSRRAGEGGSKRELAPQTT